MSGWRYYIRNSTFWILLMLFAIAANLAECFSNLVTHKAQPFFKFQVDPSLLEDGWIKWNRRSSEPKDGNNLFLSHTIQVLRSPASTNHHGPCNRLVAIARLKQMWCIATKWCATCRRSQELNLDMGLSAAAICHGRKKVVLRGSFAVEAWLQLNNEYPFEHI